MRRGDQSKLDNALAVMTADLGLARASSAAVGLGAEFGEMLADAIEATSEAVALDAQDRDDAGRPVRRYLEWARLTAGTNLGVAARMGARLAGAEAAAVNTLEAAGRKLGVSMQICEDILALAGPDPVTGCTPQRVLQEGRLTLPLILAVKAEPRLAARFVGERASADWDELLDAVRDGPGFARAAEVCERYARQAKDVAREIAHQDSPLARLCDLPTRSLSALALPSRNEATRSPGSDNGSRAKARLRLAS